MPPLDQFDPDAWALALAEADAVIAVMGPFRGRWDRDALATLILGMREDLPLERLRRLFTPVASIGSVQGVMPHLPPELQAWGRSRRGMQRHVTGKKRLHADGAARLRMCQWIDKEVGPFEDSDKCGAPVKPGSAFCPEHHARVWVKPEGKVSAPSERQGVSIRYAGKARGAFPQADPADGLPEGGW